MTKVVNLILERLEGGKKLYAFKAWEDICIFDIIPTENDYLELLKEWLEENNYSYNEYLKNNDFDYIFYFESERTSQPVSKKYRLSEM